MLRRSKRPPVVELIPCGDVDPALMQALGEDLSGRMGVQWRMGDPMPLRDEWRDAETGLYRSVHLMHALIDSAGAGDGRRGRRWRLAISDAGFCAAGVGPVFGEAEVAGCCAVVGLAPLRRGSGADPEVLRARLLTEALHELGHVAGAEHCRRASCVMYASLDIADTDRKGASFCPDCAPALKWLVLRKA